MLSSDKRTKERFVLFQSRRWLNSGHRLLEQFERSISDTIQFSKLTNLKTRRKWTNSSYRRFSEVSRGLAYGKSDRTWTWHLQIELPPLVSPRPALRVRVRLRHAILFRANPTQFNFVSIQLEPRMTAYFQLSSLKSIVTASGPSFQRTTLLKSISNLNLNGIPFETSPRSKITANFCKNS